VTLQLFDQKICQKTLTSFVEDSHAKLSVLLEKGQDSMTQEELYFLKSHGFYDISETLKNQSHTLFSKMLKAYLTTTMDEHLTQSMEFLPTLIIPLSANYLILAGFSPKIESGYTLSDILEKDVDTKYFLSEKMTKRLMSYKDNQQIPLQPDTRDVATGSYVIESELDAQKGLNQIGTIGKDSEATRVYDTTCARTIKNGGGMGAKTGLYEVRGGLQKNASTMENCSTALTEAMGKGGGHTPLLIPAQSQIRRLTPVECCRLQGFPDDWNEYGEFDGKVVPMSDTQRYKQAGNAVTVNVVQAVAERIGKIK